MSGPASTGDSSCHTPEDPDVDKQPSGYNGVGRGGTEVARVLQTVRRRWRLDREEKSRSEKGGTVLPHVGKFVGGVVDPTEESPLTPTESNVSFGQDTQVAGPAGAALAAATSGGAQQGISNYRVKSQPSEFHAATSASNSHSETHADEKSETTGIPCTGALSEWEGKHREGWRVGEGIAVPADGADAVWDRLKVFFDGKRAKSVGVVVAGTNHHEAGENRHRRTLQGHEHGRENDPMIGEDREGSCSRGRGGHAGEEATGTKGVAVVALELHMKREAVVEAVRWAWKVGFPNPLLRGWLSL